MSRILQTSDLQRAENHSRAMSQANGAIVAEGVKHCKKSTPHECEMIEKVSSSRLSQLAEEIFHADAKSGGDSEETDSAGL